MVKIDQNTYSDLNFDYERNKADNIRPLEITVTESETAVSAPSRGIGKMDCVGTDCVTICNLRDHLQIKIQIFCTRW